MEMLGRYELTTALSNKNAGSCRWCFAIRGSQQYFIKEFLEPKYPQNDLESSPQKRAKKINKCEAFQRKKAQIYRLINEYSDGNAVRVVDFFRAGAKYYMVMPKINSLNMTVEEIASLPEQAKRRICTIIAHSISRIHACAFVHADIKHTNIMIITSQSGNLTAKVIDYDAGFFESDPPTHPEEICGDQVYFSPEAWQAILGEESQLSCKLDVFAMGILFHQYLAGKLPGYDNTRFCCAGDAVAAGEKPEVSEDMPEDLHNLICRMLEADPAKRPDSQEVYQVLSQPFKKIDPPIPEPSDTAGNADPNNTVAETPAKDADENNEPILDLFKSKMEDPAPVPASAEDPKPDFVGDAPARVGWWDMGDL